MNSKLFESILIKMTDKPIEQQLEDAKGAYRYLLEDHTFVTPTGMKVRFTERGFNELFYAVENVINDTRGKGATSLIRRNANDIPELLAVVQHLGQVIDESRFHHGEPNKKPWQKPDIKSYEYMNTEVEFDNGKKRRVSVCVERRFDSKTRSYYFHSLRENAQGVDVVISSIKFGY
jgi:hypothetical protein